MNFFGSLARPVFGAVILATILAAQPAPVPFRPPANGSSVIRVWGNPRMAALVRAWREGFRRAHPEWAIEARLDGTGLAMPGIYTGAADIALFGRDTNATDDDGFEHVLNYRPLRIELATGSLAVPGQSCALAVFVHRDNPLAGFTLAQLDAIFGDELRRGHAPIRAWDALGLEGAWTKKPISLYGYDSRSGPGVFFRHVVLNDSQKIHWERYTEFSDRKTPDGAVMRAGEQAVAALAGDPAGIAIATPADASAAVKLVALASEEGGEFVPPTKATLVARRYPLARPVFACVNRPPGAVLDPKVRALLEFMLSDEGQRELADASAYLPLAPAMVKAQRAKLE